MEMKSQRAFPWLLKNMNDILATWQFTFAEFEITNKVLLKIDNGCLCAVWYLGMITFFYIMKL